MVDHAANARQRALFDVGIQLNTLITTSLGGPGGDPDDFLYLAAARAFIALKLLSLPIEDEGRLRVQLRGIDDGNGSGNPHNTDFLDECGWPPGMDTP